MMMQFPGMEGFGFILASASPRRREILARGLKDFEVIPSDFKEEIFSGKSPVDIAMDNALAKALDIGKKYPDAIVIGADTVVSLDDVVMGKPSDLEDAVRMLEALSGRTHQVVTGVAVYYASDDYYQVDFDFSDVTFKALDRTAIENYVHEKRPLDKAGAYGIQEVGDEFVEHLEGNYDNVMGLPSGVLFRLLDEVLQRAWGNSIYESQFTMF